MAWEDDATPRKRSTFELGSDLSALSVKDLEEVLELLAAERQRIENAIAAKKASGSAAESFFKR